MTSSSAWPSACVVSLYGCGGSKDDDVKAPLSSASAAASAVVQSPCPGAARRTAGAAEPR